MFAFKFWIQYSKYLKCNTSRGITMYSNIDWGSHGRNLDWTFFSKNLNVCTLEMHLHYCNNKCILHIFVGWKPLVTVSKLPSVLQSWRLSSRKGGSWSTTGRTKGKASGEAWKHPSEKVTLTSLRHTCWQNITKTLSWLLTFHDGKGPLCPSVCTAEQNTEEVPYLEV